MKRPVISAALRRKVFADAGGLCAYCRSPQVLMGVTFEIDHIHPFAAGGKTTFDNLCLSCPTCNRFKGSRLLAARSEARLYHPRHDIWEEHFEWSDDGGTLIARTGVGMHTVEALRINRPEMVSLRRYWRGTAQFRR